MIIVTGANGHLGRGIVEHLLTRVPAEDIGVSVRDPDKARGLAERGVRVRRADFADPSTLKAAFESATQVLIVSIDQIGESAVAQHTAAIRAAGSAGASRVLYTSHMGAAPDSPFAAASDHAATEAALRASGMTFTSLRNGFYANTAQWLIAGALDSGQLTAPEDGPISWTAPADLAEAAAAILVGEGSFEGPTPPLAGPAPLDLTELAAVASEVHGRSITRVTVSDDQYASDLIESGTPPHFAQLFVGMFGASRRGDFASDAPTLERVIGHPATPVRDALVRPPASAN